MAADFTLQDLLPFEISSSDITGLEDEDCRGSGSYGAVYAVTVRGISRIAKRLHSILVGTDINQSEKQGIRERFLNECLLLSKLDHPNVVKFVGVHFDPEDHSDITLIMEQLHMDLDNFLDPDQRPNIDVFTKLSILHDVSSGLLYLHTKLAKPIIHRDLTASNVLLTEDFKQAKIADLGVSKLVDHHLHRAVTRTACPGTLAYMPPEALTDKPKYDTPLDVFSFGQLALYVALQQFPQVALELSSEEAIRAYQLGEVAILKRKKWLDELPVDHCLRQLILSCLSDNPSERPSTENLNVKMKVLCGLELEEFEIKNVIGIIDGEIYSSYTAVYKVIARGAPRIAKRLNNIFDCELVCDISPSERQCIRERFYSECVALSKLDHPNILKFIGVHFNPEDRSDIAAIFERLHMSLEEVLNSQEFPDIHLNIKLSILHDITCGLLYLHTQLETPFIHGELTAANVLLTDDLKQAKIANLGVLKFLDDLLNKQSENVQALGYLSPEVFSENPKYDTPVDVFSFGHLALYVALQQLPEISHETSIVLHKKHEKEVSRRKKWIDELGQDHCLRDLILRCIKDEPEERPNTEELNNIMTTLNNANNPERKIKHAIALLNQFAELCRICRNGQLDLLKEFLYYNKEILHYFKSLRTPKGTTILHEAIDGDQPDVVQLLLLHGFNPDMRARGGGELTPLHSAVSKCSVSCVRALIENGADISIRDDQGQDAIAKAELRSKRCENVLKLLRSKEIILLVEKGALNELRKRLKQSSKPEMRDIEEAMLVAIRNGNDGCVTLLIDAGARCLNGALYLAIQLERIKAITILLVSRAIISQDSAAIRSLFFRPQESVNVPWYMPKVHKILSQGNIKMSHLIELSIFEKNFEAIKELLLRTDVDMEHKYVEWSKLKLSMLHPSCVYAIAPWVVSLKVVDNHLRKLPSEIFSATQLRRLNLSKNLLETVPADLFGLPKLEYLSLSHNRLKEIPETSNWSTSLLHLDLSVNFLSTLPQGIEHSSIETLNLSRNQLTVVPKRLCCIGTLTSLDLSYMQIQSLPKEIEHRYLDHSVNLNITNTNITDHSDGGGVLHGGIRGAQARSNKPCNHVKLIFFCPSDNVKTVILSRLKPQFKFIPNQPLPEIEVFQWSFKPLFSRKDKLLYFNTWLLGSKHCCRSIYPCFFTPGALYIITLDMTTTTDLREQIKPYVDLIIRYVPSTNIMVLAVLPEPFEGWNSEKQANVVATRLNTFFSKPSYQSLSYHGVLMFIAGQGDVIKQQIYDAAQQINVNGKHIVGRQFPETYFSVIPVLEKEQQAFRSQSKPGVLEVSTMWMLFNKILASDPPDKTEIHSMVDFLKEVGFLLHYEDPNAGLNQFYFIQPIWLYNTLLQVVRNALDHNSRLYVTHGELCSLINISWSKDVTQALIQLMIRYAIVLPIHQDQYLITFLLPNSQPPSGILYCGVLRRQFVPKVRSIPIDFWSRLLCSIISNLTRIVDVSKLKRESKTKPTMESRSKSKYRDYDTDDETDEHGSHVSALPMKRNRSETVVYATPTRGIEVWDSGMIYNHKYIKFSIFLCASVISVVEERGIQICCTQENYGYAIMARLCWLVQRNLEERFPNLFSTETPLQKHELSQIAICPKCLENNERTPSCFSVEACIHSLPQKGEQSCRHHPETIPLQDIIPDYLLLDIPSHLCLTKTMFEYSEGNLLHKSRQTVLYSGHFNGNEIAVKMYLQVDNGSIALPLSCVRRETDILSSLKHPNIIKIFGFCLDQTCVLLEKAPLGNLYQKLMNTKVKISRTVQFHIGCQVASALSYLHRRDIIYRTLKASSILLWSLDINTEISVKLANFERAAYQLPSGLMSKPTFSSSYPAPEMVQYSFREEYTEKVDIYSFGFLLYELVTRCQTYGETDYGSRSQTSKLPDAATTSYKTLVKLMDECWQKKPIARPSANDLLLKLSQPSFQCYIASQMLRDFVSVHGCCFVPSVRQIWVYGEYKKNGEQEISQGTLVFILNTENLTVQGSLELHERATTICNVDSKVWIGMEERTVHAYDTTTFKFTDRLHLDDSATTIDGSDCYVYIGQADGQLKCYPKVELQRQDCQPIIVEVGDKAINTMITDGDIVWLGCGNELVILRADDEVVIVHKTQVCESSDQVYAMAISHNTNTVWCLTRSSHNITSWDRHSTERKHITDLSGHLKWIACEFNCDPSFLAMVSIECVSDSLWVGLSCGVIMILSDLEEPKKIIHFKAHKQSVGCLLKIPHSDDLHQQHDYPVILSGGYGEVFSLSSTASEQNGVVMLWHAFTANEFSTISKRHIMKYSH